MALKIRHLGPGRFATTGPSGHVALDFNPLIQSKGLTGDFVLGHWNKALCLPAFYDSASDSYHVAQEDRIVVNAALEWVGIPKLANPGVLPTSVNYHPNARLTIKEGLLLIQEVPPAPPGGTNGATTDL